MTHDATAARSTFQQVQIDVLVLDVGLPGIAGFELLALLRQVVSAQARQPEVRAAIKDGRVTEALMKPFDIDRVLGIIEAAATG